MSDNNQVSTALRPRTVLELAAEVSGSVEGDGAALIQGVSSIQDAQDGDIVFAENSRFLSQAARSRASAIVSFVDAITPDKPLIRVDNPRYAFARILDLFKPVLNVTPGIDPMASIGRNVTLGDNISIGPHVSIGDNSVIGDGTVIMSGSHVGEGCIIGSECVIYPNVTIYHQCVLGNRCLMHSGVIIGGDGFGYMQIGGVNHKVPQIGNVEIGDEVEIGANSTVDRAKTGSTFIGDRTKIDNLVHIAHNVRIGTDCVIVALVGIAGSCNIGNRVTIAGQAGMKDHVSVGDGAMLLGRAAVFGDIGPGEVVSGYPARPHREKMRVEAALAGLPDYVKRIRALEADNARLAESSAALQKQLATVLAHLGLDEAE